jgi:tetratricopeptide (TPR) repeat protein
VLTFIGRLLSVTAWDEPDLSGIRRWACLLGICGALGGCSSPRPTTTGRSETAEKLSEQARQARDRGDSRSAEYLLTAAVDRNPADCETRLELSELLLAHGSCETAIAHLKRLISQNPDDPRGYVGLAEALYLQRDLDDAEYCLDRALDLEPRQTRGLILRGRIDEARGRKARALEDYYRVLGFEPDNGEAKLLIAELHLQQGDGPLAAPLLRSIVESGDPAAGRRDRAQWLLGQCYRAEGRWNDAARAFAAGISGRGESASDWYDLADACWRAGDLRGADLALTRSLQLSPTWAPALALRAVLDARVRETTSRI